MSWPHEDQGPKGPVLLPEAVGHYLREKHRLLNDDAVVILATLEAESEMRPLNWARNVTPPEQVAEGVPEETFDRGIAQLNSWWFRHVPNEVAYDWRQAVDVMVSYYPNLGNWNAWKSGAYKKHLRLAWCALRSLDRLEAKAALMKELADQRDLLTELRVSRAKMREQFERDREFLAGKLGYLQKTVSEWELPE